VKIVRIAIVVFQCHRAHGVHGLARMKSDRLPDLDSELADRAFRSGEPPTTRITTNLQGIDWSKLRIG
jgi:hypothetical protein